MRGAIVLAGGPGRRMGGVKALVALAGEALVLHVLRAAGKVVGELAVVTKPSMAGDLARALPPGTRIVEEPTEVQSPLVGLVAGARAIRADYVAYLACDLPLLRPRVLDLLFSRAAGHDGAVPRWPDGKIEPMASVLRREAALAAAASALDAGRYANTDMLAGLGDIRYVPMEEIRPIDPDLESFINVNTAEDLREAERRIARGHRRASR